MFGTVLGFHSHVCYTTLVSSPAMFFLLSHTLDVLVSSFPAFTKPSFFGWFMYVSMYVRELAPRHSALACRFPQQRLSLLLPPLHLHLAKYWALASACWCLHGFASHFLCVYPLFLCCGDKTDRLLDEWMDRWNISFCLLEELYSCRKSSALVLLVCLFVNAGRGCGMVGCG